MPRPPTQGECFSKLIHHIREAQEQCCLLMHLANANDDPTIGAGWFKIQEGFEQMHKVVTQLAMGKLQ